MPDAPVGVGFVGAGNVLPGYLQVLDRLVPRGLAVEGPVCARDTSTWPELRRRRPGITLVETVEEVLDSNVDVVVVITPPGTHAELALAALARGKHVLVEKPFAETRAEGEELATRARERGLHALAAPFVQLAPTFRMLWTLIADGAIGRPHVARGLYGNPGATWAPWYHDGTAHPLGELGIYNLKSLTSLLGPVIEVVAAEAVAEPVREAGGTAITSPGPDVAHVVLRHAGGALSTVTASQAIQHYRRPGLEVYGTAGTANLLGDDWDPRGIELYRTETGHWEVYDPWDSTWLWADGLRELVTAVATRIEPLASIEHDLHLLDVVEAARVSATERAWVPVDSAFAPLDLRLEIPAGVHVHDHTRPPDQQ